ncbi:hypothetical protein M405DRAFT_829629 [Rhizopogon salebrosus TDB-379]|nr:hypothetical protein M405DRAFT_829629 [Rhizopogon salebrosus TDB-379]
MPRLHSFLFGGEHNPFIPESISGPARQQRTLGTYLGFAFSGMSHHSLEVTGKDS